MKKYGVRAIWSQEAYVEVEAENEEEAENLGYEKIMHGEADYDSELDDIPDIEVEEIEKENETGT